MKEITWEEVHKLPSGSLVRSVGKEQEAENDPVCYDFVVIQEAEMPVCFTTSMIREGALQFYPEDVGARFGELNLADGNIVGFVYTHEGTSLGVGKIDLPALKHYVFEPMDVAELLATTMRLIAGYRTLAIESAQVCAKAAKPLFGRDAF